MTESSQGNTQGFGPLPEGAEPTAPTGSAPSAGPPGDTPTGGPAGGTPSTGPGGDTPTGGPAGGTPSTGPGGSVPARGLGSGVPARGLGSGVSTGGLGSGVPSTGPGSGVPTGGPIGGVPTGHTPGYGPFQGGDPFGGQQPGWTDTPYGFSTPPGRRIEPSPPPDRSRLFMGMTAGLVAGLLLFGTAGYFAGRATAPTSPAAATSGGPGVFEQNQMAVNRDDFQGTGLTAISEGFLPYLSACTRPKANAGEKVRVRCTLDGMSAIFVEYDSLADRDEVRARALGQAVDARSLAPGAAPAAERATPSGRVTGNYLEYAYRLTESGVTRTVSGIWWDDARTPVAGYLLAYWKEGLREKWEPMRDLWSRYA